MLRILKAFLGIVGPSLESIGYPTGEYPKTVLRWRTPGYHGNPNLPTGSTDDRREALERKQTAKREE